MDGPPCMPHLIKHALISCVFSSVSSTHTCVCECVCVCLTTLTWYVDTSVDCTVCVCPHYQLEYKSVSITFVSQTNRELLGALKVCSSLSLSL